MAIRCSSASTRPEVVANRAAPLSPLFVYKLCVVTVAPQASFSPFPASYVPRYLSDRYQPSFIRSLLFPPADLAAKTWLDRVEGALIVKLASGNATRPGRNARLAPKEA
jgi:hypothetical protein